MENAKILVVDDEKNIRDLVCAYLEKENYQVKQAEDGPGGLALARSFQPDLIVLDIMLPGMDGLSLLTELRKTSEAYVILLTAKTEEVDKIVGLSIGADDYLTKPFSPRELVARIKAALRRIQSSTANSQSAALYEFDHLRVDPAGFQVWVDGQPVDLTTIEFKLLLTLIEHSGIVLSREQLLERVWGANYYGETRVVDVHIGNLRKKLLREEIIVTVRGVGYRFSKKDA